MIQILLTPVQERGEGAKWETKRIDGHVAFSVYVGVQQANWKRNEHKLIGCSIGDLCCRYFWWKIGKDIEDLPEKHAISRCAEAMVILKAGIPVFTDTIAGLLSCISPAKFLMALLTRCVNCHSSNR